MAAAASELSTRHCDSYATVEATVTWNQSGKGFNLIGGEEEAAIARRVEPYFRVSHHSPVLGIQLGPFDRLTAAPLGHGFLESLHCNRDGAQATSSHNPLL